MSNTNEPNNEAGADASNRYFGFDLDDSWEEMWHEAERVQDGGCGHHLAFQAESAKSAAHLFAARLIPFIEKKMYESDADGYQLEES